MAAEVYSGPVCYVGHDHDGPDGAPLLAGWHYSVVKDADGNDVAGVPLVLDDDGVYREADTTDESWHARKHQSFQTFQMEDGSVERVNEEEGSAIRELLQKMRGGNQEGGEG